MHAGIRRLAAGDAAKFRHLRLRALREHPEAFTSSHDEDEKLTHAETQPRLQSEEQRFWGAFDADQLCGIAGLQREQRARNRHKATLVGMYVAPEAGRNPTPCGWDGRSLAKNHMSLQLRPS